MKRGTGEDLPGTQIAIRLMRDSTAAGSVGQAAGSMVYTLQRKRIPLEAERIEIVGMEAKRSSESHAVGD